MLLKIVNLTHFFGGLKAVDDFNIEIGPRQIIGLIGPNGAGKTTVFNLVTGFYKPTMGKIFFQDEDITGLPPHVITSKGIVRTFQNIRLFNNMTVLENVTIARHYRMQYGITAAVGRFPSFHREEHEVEEKALEYLSIFHLDSKVHLPAGSLPYGQQRRLEIARALATEPKLLLLDEPAAGMNNAEALELMHLIKKIAEEFRLSILLIEHQMPVVMGIAERIHVLDFGKTIAVGPPEEIKNNPKVIEAYLGEGALE
ncbi:MAG: ABC transporter ATP-binding protein [Spirochaetes bacterium]|nr:ABC transporter ATP-binding protein [Spirochaetota bacterium]